jgi:hypothetical protein
VPRTHLGTEGALPDLEVARQQGLHGGPSGGGEARRRGEEWRTWSGARPGAVLACQPSAPGAGVTCSLEERGSSTRRQRRTDSTSPPARPFSLHSTCSSLAASATLDTLSHLPRTSHSHITSSLVSLLRAWPPQP